MIEYESDPIFHAETHALQAAVDAVDGAMSTWKPESRLMQLNAAPVGHWIKVPQQLLDVLRLALDIGRASGGAFDIGMGDAVSAWGFWASEAAPEQIRAALERERRPAHDVLELDVEGGMVRKSAAITLDLNGIAKGYGVDRLAEILRSFGISSGLVGIDGEMRALGLRPDGSPWSIAVEAPDYDRRAAHSVLALQDAAVATSGDYRHWINVNDYRLSHTMDPRRGAPLMEPPASVTVVTRTCAEADAWATALMVLGPKTGAVLARRLSFNVLFLLRARGTLIRCEAVGELFTRSHSGVQRRPLANVG
ncbi:FAD:protein FMN transferase [Brucella pituitosa]|uniref:FAD:protein FMN transferase n=1 Tax=Brucella pituitosa TaxID=571256 RepID=UPI001FE55590|nr:FAD:protein FMN transferase [Brucella pituitosa]